MSEPSHHYTITPADPGAHLFEVTLTIAEPDPAGQVVALPAWIPGSYMIRDYAKNVVSIRAKADDDAVELTPLDKSRWQAAPVQTALTVVLEVHAFDDSVRGAHLDTTHAYFNGPCVFPSVEGQEDRECRLTINPPPKPMGAQWRVATSMRRDGAETYGYGDYRAADYDELIDHPVEIGDLQIGEFEAAGIPHAIAVRGATKFDMARLCHDLSTLCTKHLEFLGPPPGFDRYLFLLQVTNDGYGGLEHRWSSSLVCARNELPVRGDSGVSNGYRRLLGLCSHEYFHLWNIKRLRPRAFIPFDLQNETYTGLLWVFEGITSYYDDLTLLRAGLITPESYLDLLGQLVTRIQRTAGRHRQSVEESSFYAWTKFYKQDANGVNAIVSYYAKGALISLALDLTLRHGTEGRITLDDVVRECWQRWGATGEGMPERGLESLAIEVSGMELGDFFERYVRGTADLPLAQLLREVGVTLNWRAAESTVDTGGKSSNSTRPAPPWFGAKIGQGNGHDTVRLVHAGSPAQQAGIAPGDEVVAFDNVRLTATNLDALLRTHQPGDRVPLTVFRRDSLLTLSVELADAPEDTAWLTLDSEPTDAQADARRAWLSLND